MANLLKVVFLGLAGFGLLVFLTAEKPKQIVANDNVINIVNEYRDNTGLTCITDKHQFVRASVENSVESKKYGKKILPINPAQPVTSIFFTINLVV